MENILIDDLPHTVEINGEDWPIDWGYRALMLCEIDLFQSNKSDEVKMQEVLNIFYKDNVPDDIEAAMNQFLRFFTAKEEKQSEQDSMKASGARAYDFDQDAHMIYAAFRSQYGINLNKIKNKDLHWWEFLALFNSLNDDLLISKVMYWRTVRLKDVPKSERKFVRRMKKLYAIKGEQTQSDMKTKLMRRNAKMKEYVRKRMEACETSKK